MKYFSVFSLSLRSLLLLFVPGACIRVTITIILLYCHGDDDDDDDDADAGLTAREYKNAACWCCVFYRPPTLWREARSVLIGTIPHVCVPFFCFVCGIPARGKRVWYYVLALHTAAGRAGGGESAKEIKRALRQVCCPMYLVRFSFFFAQALWSLLLLAWLGVTAFLSSLLLLADRWLTSNWTEDLKLFVSCAFFTYIHDTLLFIVCRYVCMSLGALIVINSFSYLSFLFRCYFLTWWLNCRSGRWWFSSYFNAVWVPMAWYKYYMCLWHTQPIGRWWVESWWCRYCRWVLNRKVMAYHCVGNEMRISMRIYYYYSINIRIHVMRDFSF